MTEHFAEQSMPASRRRRKAHWFAPLDAASFEAADVIALLRRLGHEALAFLFEGGSQPRLSRADAKALQPLFGGNDWMEKRPGSYLGYLDSVLYFTGNNADFSHNEMALALGATVQKRFWRRWAFARKARGAGLIGGEMLAPVLLEGAWSDPSFQMHALGVIRKDWRQRTLHYPDDIDWPDYVSIRLVLILVLLALSGDNGKKESHVQHLGRRLRAWWQKPVRRMERRLSLLLPPALAAAVEAVDLEHLVVMDAIVRVPGALRSEPVRRFCERSALGGVYGFAGDANEAEANEAEAGGAGREQMPDREEEEAVLALGSRLAGRLL
nr:hypothetical protein [uncultured Cohaesibacter sp.]